MTCMTRNAFSTRNALKSGVEAISTATMKTRRHHNNSGYRQIRNGRTVKQVREMARRLREERKETPYVNAMATNPLP
jgi:hypothetical protein